MTVAFNLLSIKVSVLKTRLFRKSYTHTSSSKPAYYLQFTNNLEVAL